MSRVFLDTGCLLALELARDQNHSAAMQQWQSVTGSLPAFATTSYVFDEVVTYLSRRGHHAKAVQVEKNLLLSQSVELVHVDKQLFGEGWDYFQQHQDKEYSLTECISFIVIKDLSVQVASSFDGRCVQAGFMKEP